MIKDLSKRVKEIIAKIEYITIATVDETVNPGIRQYIVPLTRNITSTGAHTKIANTLRILRLTTEYFL
jgi:hypothetical protein